MKKIKKDVGSFVGANVMIGAGALGLGAAGFSVAPLGAAAGLMPVVGVAMMGGHAIRKVKDLKKVKRKWKPII